MPASTSSRGEWSEAMVRIRRARTYISLHRIPDVACFLFLHRGNLRVVHGVSFIPSVRFRTGVGEREDRTYTLCVKQFYYWIVDNVILSLGLLLGIIGVAWVISSLILGAVRAVRGDTVTAVTAPHTDTMPPSRR